MMSTTATLLDGKQVSKNILENVARETRGLSASQKPRLAAVLVGENPASEIYVANKIRTCCDIDIESELHRFPATVEEGELIGHLQGLNQNPLVNAVLVQLPLPNHINSERVLETVLPEKDVDGFHPVNLGKLILGIEPAALPCTPAGIIQLLDYYNLSVEGKRAAVVGRSNIVGKPITLMLTHRNATVTLCHSKTQGLQDILKTADLVVAATGKAGLVTGDDLKPGAVIVDVGINRLENKKIVGDVDFESARQVAGYITPVPGGVGPMTIATLMVNTLRLYKLQQGERLKSLLFV